MNQPERAEAAFGKALRANRALAAPSHEPLYQYAIFLRGKSRPQEAGKLIDEALAIAPEFGPAHLEKAKSLAEEGRTEQAAAEAEQALALSESIPYIQRTAHAFLAKM